MFRAVYCNNEIIREHSVQIYLNAKMLSDLSNSHSKYNCFQKTRWLIAGLSAIFKWVGNGSSVFVSSSPYDCFL